MELHYINITNNFILLKTYTQTLIQNTLLYYFLEVNEHRITFIMHALLAYVYHSSCIQSKLQSNLVFIRVWQAYKISIILQQNFEISQIIRWRSCLYKSINKIVYNLHYLGFLSLNFRTLQYYTMQYGQGNHMQMLMCYVVIPEARLTNIDITVGNETMYEIIPYYNVNTTMKQW